jgi:hypothetical protein
MTPEQLSGELGYYIERATKLDSEIAQTQQRLRELQLQRESLLLETFLKASLARIPEE